MRPQTLYVFLLVAAATVAASPLNTDKPAFSCPPGEVYEKCAPVHCYKSCTHLVQEPACPIVSADCFIPACECAGETLRDEHGTCVPRSQCPT